MDIDLTGLDGAMAQRSFTGVIAVHADGRRVAERCAGYRHRAHRVPMTVDTRIAVASGSKAFTALAVMRLVDDGRLRLDQPVREVHEAVNRLVLEPAGLTRTGFLPLNEPPRMRRSATSMTTATSPTPSTCRSSATPTAEHSPPPTRWAIPPAALTWTSRDSARSAVYHQ